MLWGDVITENPTLGAIETWEMYNFTEDAHPIHIHLVQFQVVGREAIGGGPSVAGSNDPPPVGNRL
ncbi:MAG: multicopper oxidase domain-containing protein [Nitrospirota bacterium]